jgi:predicted transcriptional regulator
MPPITARDLMNPDILTVRDDMTVPELAAFLMAHEISGAPVESRTGQLIGVVSVADIARAASENDSRETEEHPFFLRPETGELTREDRELLEDEERKLLVSDIMTPEIHTVTEDAAVSEIATLLVDNDLHRLLVTSAGKPAGILSTSDMLGLLIEDQD